VALLALDLGLFHRKVHAITLKEALVLSGDPGRRCGRHHRFDHCAPRTPELITSRLLPSESQSAGRLDGDGQAMAASEAAPELERNDHREAGKRV
jgi:hypothetical protein